MLVAVSNNVIAIGAREADTTAGHDACSARIFTRRGAKWTKIQRLAPTDSSPGACISSGLALSFGNLITGASDKALNSSNGRGAVYYFTQPARKVKLHFDGDTLADISIFRTSKGQWWFNRLTAGAFATSFGVGTVLPTTPATERPILPFNDLQTAVGMFPEAKISASFRTIWHKRRYSRSCRF